MASLAVAARHPAGRSTAPCCALPFAAGALDRGEECAFARCATFAAVAGHIDNPGFAPAPFDIGSENGEGDGPFKIGGLRCHRFLRSRA